MIVTLEEAKQYLRVDGNESDELITALIEAAGVYLQNATGNQFDNTNHLAKLFCLVLVGDWYENREYSGKPGEGIRPIINSILVQLQHSYPLILSSALPDAVVGVEYKAALTAIGGQKPYIWAIETESALPEGLILDKNGIVSGTPLAAGQSIITIKLTDSSPTPKTVKRQVSIEVVESE